MNVARTNDDLSGPVEDYLKVIYDVERQSGAAATNDIAQRLSVAPASVSGMIRRLAEQGLVSHEPYRGVRLTDSGRRAALRTLRRHRVIESYLTQALGYAWDRVHDEAERLEHAASDELIDRMAAAIGEPETDPHGAPIPTREGNVDERSLHSLADVLPGKGARVVRVSDKNPALLRYLAEVDIVPGVEVTVLGREPFGGPIELKVGNTKRAIGAELARQVLVEDVAGE
jgi:DtxR family Mn-dependent transcriptional regulator